jgi:hypothetical protein
MAKTCFVLMGFGEKTDFRTDRKLNLDKTYKIIQSAVEACGVSCIRADDIIHSSVIDKPMYEQLLEADIAIADLSTSNENAIYELGVRHALRPNTTIVIAESRFSFPFDLNHLLIRTYDHLGTGIDFEEAERLKKNLMDAIRTLLDTNEVDSPVYTFLPDLNPPSRKPTPPGGSGDLQPAVVSSADEQSFSVLLDAYHGARTDDDYAAAKGLLTTLRKMKPRDPYLIQQQALVTYKSRQPDTVQALNDARAILQEHLPPDTTSDPETLGLWGAIHKRLWEEQGDMADLNTSVAAYERGFYLRRDYYTGINYAFLLDLRAAQQADPDEALADRVIARRVRQQVLHIVDATLDSLPRARSGQPGDPHEAYWLGATRLEAMLGLGMLSEMEQEKNTLYETAPEPWMRGSTDEQLTKLQLLLEEGAARTIRPPGMTPE